MKFPFLAKTRKAPTAATGPCGYKEQIVRCCRKDVCCTSWPVHWFVLCGYHRDRG